MHFAPLKPPRCGQYRNIYQEDPSPGAFARKRLVMIFLEKHFWADIWLFKFVFRNSKRSQIKCQVTGPDNANAARKKTAGDGV